MTEHGVLITAGGRRRNTGAFWVGAGLIFSLLGVSGLAFCWRWAFHQGAGQCGCVYQYYTLPL